MKKRASAWVMILAILFAAPACAAEDAGEDLPTLYIYTWLDYFDYEVLYEFEQANNCILEIGTFDSNESMYEKLNSGGGGFDVITPSSYMSSIMQKEKMLLPLDHSRIPRIRNIDKAFTRHTEDPDMTYAVPYTRTVTGVGYDAERVDAKDLGSWDIFGNPAYAGKMTMLDDMREALGAALKYLGHSINSTDDAELAEAREVLLGWKENLAKFGVDDAKNGLAKGEFLVAQGYNGDMALIMEEAEGLGFYVPEEGSSLAADDFVISADSLYPDLAHAFINYMLDPEVARRNMEAIRYYMPIPDAIKILDPALRENPVFNVDPKILDTCEVIRDLGGDNAKYEAAWEGISEAEE